MTHEETPLMSNATVPFPARSANQASDARPSFTAHDEGGPVVKLTADGMLWRLFGDEGDATPGNFAHAALLGLAGELHMLQHSLSVGDRADEALDVSTYVAQLGRLINRAEVAAELVARLDSRDD